MAGGKTAHTRIAVKTDIDALEQLVGVVACSGQKPTAIGRKATDEAIDQMVMANRPRVRVRRSYVGRQIYLAAKIERVSRAPQSVEWR